MMLTLALCHGALSPSREQGVYLWCAHQVSPDLSQTSLLSKGAEGNLRYVRCFAGAKWHHSLAGDGRSTSELLLQTQPDPA